MKLKDIPVIPHSFIEDGKCQRVIFPNGLGLSILSGSNGFFHSSDGTYEVALISATAPLTTVVSPNPGTFAIVYDHPLSDRYFNNDVIGWQTEDRVNELLDIVEHYNN